MATLRDIQPALQYAVGHRDEAVSLAEMASAAGQRTFSFHRAFASVANETPRQYTERLRLDRAAALLLSTKLTILEIALACGYQSHEVFVRAFRRRFRIIPSHYRRKDAVSAEAAQRALELGPCLHFYRYQTPEKFMAYTIDVQQLNAQPILCVRRRVKRDDIAATIGSSLGAIVAYAMQHGSAINGHPITRYSEMGTGMVTMEPAMRVSSHPPADPTGAVINDTLPAGPAAVTTHMGSYDQLPAAYAALEIWMHESGYKPSGAPWEDYITDPAEVPDPKDWRTDIYWPVVKA